MNSDKNRRIVKEQGYVDERGYICFSVANQIEAFFIIDKTKRQFNLPKCMILSLKENHLHIFSAKMSGAIGDYFGSIDIRRLEYISKSTTINGFYQFQFMFHAENGLQIPFYINPTGSSDEEWYGEQIALAIRKAEKDYSVIITQEKIAEIEENETDETHSGQFILSKKFWKKNQELSQMTSKEQKLSNKYIKRVTNYLCFGDTQPAMVVCLDPVLVAVYSDEMDAVVVLKFPQEFKTNYELALYQKLISANMYFPYHVTGMSKDIFPGEKYLGRWSDFYPIIADFITEDSALLNEHRMHIDDSLWNKVQTLGLEYVEKHFNLIRDGLFYMKKDIKNSFLDQIIGLFKC